MSSTHIRESFPTLEDGSGVGQVLAKVLEGDASANKNASAALVAKKADGTLVYLRADDAGNISVTLDGAGIPKKGRGSVTGSQSQVTVFDIALTANKEYRNLSGVFSCFRDTEFEIVSINDPSGTPTEEILADILTGAGQYTAPINLRDLCFTAGATSPILRVRAKNLNATSLIRASVTFIEDAA